MPRGTVSSSREKSDLFDMFAVSDYIGVSQRHLQADLSSSHGSHPRYRDGVCNRIQYCEVQGQSHANPTLLVR